MSIIDDFAAINRALREKHEHSTMDKAAPQPQQDAQAQQAAPWDSSQQNKAQRRQTAQQAKQFVPICDLCHDVGFIGVMRSGLWVGIQCLSCGNPTRRKNPLP